MKHAFISPINALETTRLGDFYLILSHLLEHKKYADFYDNSNRYKIMDNGAFENGVAEEAQSLLDKCSKHKIDMVVAPDVLYDRKNNLDSLRSFCEIHKKSNATVKVMGVVQADNSLDFLSQYKEFCELDIDAIGLSILAMLKSWQLESKTMSRLQGLKEIARLNIKHKPCHLLGLGESCEDLKYAATLDWIKSNDTSAAFGYALNDDIFDSNGRTITTRKNLDFTTKSELTYRQLICLLYNMIHLKATGETI